MLYFRKVKLAEDYLLLLCSLSCSLFLDGGNAHKKPVWDPLLTVLYTIFLI